MANITSISNKIARNAQVLGITVVSQQYDTFGNASVTLQADAGTITISYVLAEIQYPMGGVNPMVSPYLGIGIANPGQLLLQSSVSSAGTMADIINGPISAQILAMCAWFDNDLYLANAAFTPAGGGSAGPGTGGYSVRLRGDSDLLGMGQ
jgi:hypothetical protein